jgi:hypothetical protein
MSENDVKEAFDAYRAEPGGEVRLDTASITAAGRRRVQRRSMLLAIGSFAVGAALVGGAIPLFSGDDGKQSVTVADSPGKSLPPATDRDVNVLFTEARGWQEGKVQVGGVARDTAAVFLAKLGAAAPTNADTAWRPSEDDPKQPGAQFALLTWANGGKAAEGLLTIEANPIHALTFPAPYQVCQQSDGTNCTVRQVAGKGWLKETHATENGVPVFRASLQHDNGPAVTFVISEGATTKAGLVKGMQPMGKFPVDAEQISKAVLGTP